MITLCCDQHENLFTKCLTCLLQSLRKQLAACKNGAAIGLISMHWVLSIMKKDAFQTPLEALRVVLPLWSTDESMDPFPLITS